MTVINLSANIKWDIGVRKRREVCCDFHEGAGEDIISNINLPQVVTWEIRQKGTRVILRSFRQISGRALKDLKAYKALLSYQWTSRVLRLFWITRTTIEKRSESCWTQRLIRDSAWSYLSCDPQDQWIAEVIFSGAKCKELCDPRGCPWDYRLPTIHKKSILLWLNILWNSYWNK